MKNTIKTIIAASAVGLGLAAVPASAQIAGPFSGQGFAQDRSVDDQGVYGRRGAGRATGYDENGSLNVFGARLDPRAARGNGLVGGVVGTATGVTSGVIDGVGLGDRGTTYGDRGAGYVDEGF